MTEAAYSRCSAARAASRWRRSRPGANGPEAPKIDLPDSNIKASRNIYVNGVFCRIMATMHPNLSRPGEVCLGLRVTHRLFDDEYNEEESDQMVTFLMHSHELRVEGPQMVHHKVIRKQIEYMFSSEYLLFHDISGKSVEEALQGLLSEDGMLKGTRQSSRKKVRNQCLMGV